VREGDQGEAKLAEVTRWRDSELFTEPERVALEYAERMTRTGERVDDVLFKRLQRHYSEAQIVELTAAIALREFSQQVQPGARRRGAGLLLRSAAIAGGPLPLSAAEHRGITLREGLYQTGKP
jgi:hypothetical protein